MTNLDSILKSRDINYLADKFWLVKAMVFPVVMYGYDSWAIKMAEHWRIDAFESWCWRRLLKVPWTSRKSNQFILKEISSEYSLEGLILKLKLQYFGHLMWRVDSLRKTLMLGKVEGRRRTGWQRMRWLDGITNSTDMSFSSCPGGGDTGRSTPGGGDGQGGLACCKSMELQRVGHDRAAELTSWLNFLYRYSLMKTSSFVLQWQVCWILYY